MKNLKNRVFIGNIEVAGHYQSIARNLINRGYRVTVVGSATYRRNPQQIETKPIPVLYEKVLGFLKKNRLMYRVAREPFAFTFGLLLLVWAVRNHDWFILYGGGKFVNYRIDYKVLRWCGKKVVVNCAHGTESRPPYINAKLAKRSLIRLLYETFKISSRAKAIENNASNVIGLPCLSHFYRRPMISRDMIGKNAPVSPMKVFPKKTKKESVRIVHVPSDPITKGSAEVRDAVNYVIRNVPQLNVEYHEIANIPNSDVISVLKNSDIIVTQMFSDIAWPTTALEAAAVFTLPIVGGLDAPSWNCLSSRDMGSNEPLFVKSEDVREALLYFTLNHDDRRKKIENLNKLVQESASSDVVTRNYINLLEGDFPSEWYFDPCQVTGVFGDGMSRSERAKYLCQYLSVFGRRGLMIPVVQRVKRITAECKT